MTGPNRGSGHGTCRMASKSPSTSPVSRAGQGQRHDPSGLTDKAQVEDQEQGDGGLESDQQDRGQEPQRRQIEAAGPSCPPASRARSGPPRCRGCARAVCHPRGCHPSGRRPLPVAPEPPPAPARPRSGERARWQRATATRWQRPRPAAPGRTRRTAGRWPFAWETWSWTQGFATAFRLRYCWTAGAARAARIRRSSTMTQGRHNQDQP